MNEQPVVVQKVSWQDLCPWTIIFKTLPIATSMTVIVLALLGVVLTPIGWMISEALCVRSQIKPLESVAINFAVEGDADGAAATEVLPDIEKENVDLEFMEVLEINASPYRSVFPEAHDPGNAFRVLETDTNISGPRLVFQQLISSFRSMFDSTKSGSKFLYFLLGSIWSVLVWSFVGIGITRVCLLRLTRNEAAGLDDAFEFAFDNWHVAAGAIGIPFAAIAVLCIPTLILGLLMGFDLGVLLVGILWFVVLAISLAIALLLLGLMFGWPLMIASVAAESQNSFDAMTRSFAYTFQRPVHYVFYMFVAAVFGGCCWLVVGTLTNGVVELAYWTTSWGTNVFGESRMEVLRGYELGAGENAVESGWSSLNSGRGMIGLWNAMAKTIAAAFVYGLFWCMAAAIYLLLRKDVDETETDEIFLVDERRSYELPPLQSDENGIPQVQELREVSEETDEPTDGD